MNEILQVENKILRLRSEAVAGEQIKSAKISKLLELMQRLLDASPDGVALAAPQVGRNVRIFIISPKAFGDHAPIGEHLVYINPVVTRLSAKKIECDEGCLSVRNVYGRIKRHEKVTVEAFDERGNRFIRGASGLLAEIFQHEIDHLDGILFIDNAKDLREVKPNHE